MLLFLFFVNVIFSEDRQPEYSIFAGDLSPDCTEPILLVSFLFSDFGKEVEFFSLSF